MVIIKCWNVLTYSDASPAINQNGFNWNRNQCKEREENSFMDSEIE